MAGEEPPFLPVGTDVSAKYRGAFCEAKVKKLVKLVKCKMTLKDCSHIIVTDENINGPLKTGLCVEIKHPETGQLTEGTINKITDHSTYTVVFDDGDENTLRRTQLCLKGEKHFVKSETLDQLPLTHPEHFGTPVMKPKRRRGANHDSDSDSDDDSSVESEAPKREYKGRLAEMIGRIVMMEIEDRKKAMWVPVLVTDPNANDLDLKTKDHLLVKSFKDSKFYAVLKKETKEFTRDVATKNEDKLLKNSFEKSLAYFDSKDLPSNWDKDELLGCDSEDGSDCESSDDEPSEEKDRFVAQLYKFMDDRGTSINKTPLISSKDVNLYRLFRVVQNIGGYNRVTNQAKWKAVFSKMSLPACNTGANQVKTIYKKYLHAFEDFYRKLGSSMGTISRPSRSRHTSNRGLLSSREREVPRSPRIDKDKSKSEKPQASEAEKSKSDKKEEDKKGDDSENDSPRKSSRIRKANVDDRPEEDERKLPEVTKPVTRVEASRLAKEEAKPSKEETGKGKDKKDLKARDDTPSKRGRGEETRAAVKDEVRKSMTKKVPDEDTKVKDEVAKVKEEPAKAVSKEEKDEGRPKKGRKRLKDDEKEQTENVKKKKKGEDKDSDDEKDAEGDDEDDDQDQDPEDDDEDGDTPREPVKLRRRKEPEVEYGIGSKLKVRYGRGRNIKTYEAKILEADAENGTMHYLVHYSGWNNRYDEWVMKDRIVGLVELVEPSKAPPTKPKASKFKHGCKKKGRPSSSGNSTPTHTPSESPKPPSARTKSPIQAGPPSKSRPTRHTSVEQSATPSLRRSRRASSSLQETTDAQSHFSDSDSDDRSVKEERDDALSIAESTDSKRPPSPEPPKLKEEVSIPIKETLPESLSPVKLLTSASDVQSPVKLESPEQMDTAVDVKESEEPEVLPMAKSEPLEVPALEQVKEEELEKETENEAVPELVMQTEEAPVRPMAGLETSEDEKDSQPPVIDKEVHTAEDDISPQADDAHKQDDKTKDAKKTKKGKKKAAEIKKEDVPERPEAGDATPMEKEEPVTEIKTEGPSEVIEKEIPTQQESPEKEGKKVKGEKKGEKKKGNLSKKAEKKEEGKVEEGEKKVDPEKKKLKKKAKKKDEEEKTKVAEKKKSSEQRSGFDIYDFKEESQDSEQQALMGLASLHNVCLATAPQRNVSEMMEASSSLVAVHRTDASTLRDALTLVAASTSNMGMVHPDMASQGTSAVQERDNQASIASANLPSSSTFVASAATAGMVYDNTPPDTPEHSEDGLSPQVMASPSQQGDGPVQKHENIMEPIAHPTPLGGDSPSACDMSTISNSSGGSSGNLPSGESSGEGGSKRKRESEVETTPGKKRRRSAKRGQVVEKPKTVTKTSDSDEASNVDNNPNAVYASPSRKNVINPHNIVLPPNRPPKFNFNLEEGKNYEGERRINFLSDKMLEIRKMYMQLKAEVACIDRRRKRARRKEKEANTSHSNGQNQSHNQAASICYAS